MVLKMKVKMFFFLVEKNSSSIHTQRFLSFKNLNKKKDAVRKDVLRQQKEICYSIAKKKTN